ncbi:MAG: hypothetical protein WD206_09365 [Actinomycetota bacterium]
MNRNGRRGDDREVIDRSGDANRGPVRALWTIAAVSVVGQLALVPIGRAASWDEAIYLSQVAPDAPTLPFVASRARGIVALVAPLAGTGVPLTAIRILLAIVAAVAIAGAFRVWVHPLGWGAPLGAALFGSSWLVLLYGGEVMPNLWSAILAVAATGFAVEAASVDVPGHPDAERHRRRSLFAAGIALSAMAFVRPSDAVFLAVALVFVPAFSRRDRRLAATIGAGVLAGLAPWIVEMTVRFGGPGGAVRAALDASHVSAVGGFGERLLQHAALSDGPTIGPVSEPVSVLGVAWWLWLVVLAVVALSARPRRRGVTAAVVAAAALGAGYLVFVGGYAPRFLLPALALLSVAAGAGALSLGARWVDATPGRSRGAIAVGAIALAITGLLLVWNVATAVRVGEAIGSTRATERRAGETVRELAAGEDCAVVATAAFPQIGLASGCRSRPVRPGEDPIAWLAVRASAGDRVFVAVGPGTSSPIDGAGVLAATEGWTIYEP